MSAAALGLLALASSAAPAEGATAEELPRQTLVFYNARLALREGQPAEALSLWLLHNSLADQDRHRGAEEEEFRSVVWAALGSAGLCPDGFPRDTRGAGLWPLALHNWLVAALAKGPPQESEAPFEAFEVGRQQRFVSLHDVLSAAELASLSFHRSEWCLLPGVLELEARRTPFLDFTDRLQVGTLMRRLLTQSLGTLARDKVASVAAVEARLFDLDLALAQLARERKRLEGLEAQQEARAVGVSAAGAREVRAQVEAWDRDSAQAAFLRKTLGWGAGEWLSLGKERRLALFAQAQPLAEDRAALDRLELALIDALTARQQGQELEAWLAFFDARTAERRRLLTEGARGERLLALEPSTGFRERAAVALHRGVAFLEAGARGEALRSFAYALAKADESRQASQCRALARRWLSYVLAHYQADQDVVATLKALLPRQEYPAVVEELVWRAALRADAASFERLVAAAPRGGAFDARVAQLRFLARGNPGALATALRAEAADEPHFTLRFIKRLFEELESESADVRRANLPMLRALVQVLDGIGGAAGPNQSQARTAEELVARAHAVLEGLGAFDVSPAGKARGLSPAHEAFAGNVRLAPADALPWPFAVPEVEAPSAFTPLTLRPVEWRDASGRLVFGWSLEE